MNPLTKLTAGFLSLLLLCGCQVQPEPLPQTDTTGAVTESTPEGTGTAIDVSGPEFTEPLPSGNAMSTPTHTNIIHLWSLEEYNAFLEEIGDHPSLLLTYEDIAELGEFESAFFFVCEPTDWVECTYTLIDACGYRFDFSIGYILEDGTRPPLKNNEPIRGQVDPQDLRQVADYETGCYLYKNISYVYINGALGGLYWYVDDLYFCIAYRDNSINGSEPMVDGWGFWRYPMDGEETFIRGLLSLETVEQTLAQIDAFVP